MIHKKKCQQTAWITRNNKTTWNGIIIKLTKRYNRRTIADKQGLN